MTLDPLVVFGAIGSILGTVFATGLGKKWVWGWQLVDMTKDRDFWRSVALDGLQTTERAVSMVSRDA